MSGHDSGQQGGGGTEPGRRLRDFPLYLVAAQIEVDGKPRPLYLTHDGRRPLSYLLADAASWGSPHDAVGLVATFNHWAQRFGLPTQSARVMKLGAETLESANGGIPEPVPQLGPEATVKPPRDFSGRDGSEG